MTNLTHADRAGRRRRHCVTRPAASQCQSATPRANDANAAAHHHGPVAAAGRVAGDHQPRGRPPPRGARALRGAARAFACWLFATQTARAGAGARAAMAGAAPRPCESSTHTIRGAAAHLAAHLAAAPRRPAQPSAPARGAEGADPASPASTRRRCHRPTAPTERRSACAGAGLAGALTTDGGRVAGRGASNGAAAAEPPRCIGDAGRRGRR